MNLQSLTHKKAVVTGGSGGIGKEISRYLAECGADVTVHGSRKSEKFDSFLSELKQNSKGKIDSIEYDFESENFLNLEKSYLFETVKTADILCVCFGPFL